MSMLSEAAFEEMRRDRRNAAHEVTMAVANDSLLWSHTSHSYRCHWCQRTWDYADRRDRYVPANHSETCIWRIAKLYAEDVTPEVEPGTKHELAMQLLRWLGSEHRVASYHEAFQELFDGGLLVHRAGDDYAISDAGRAALEAAGG